MSSHDPSNQSLNPYAAPLADPNSIPVEAALGEEQETKALRAFVGTKADYYLGKWAAALKRRGAGTGFNWAAFLLSGLWMPYRKMYMPTVILYGAMLLSEIIEDFVIAGLFGNEDASNAV